VDRIHLLKVHTLDDAEVECGGQLVRVTFQRTIKPLLGVLQAEGREVFAVALQFHLFVVQLHLPFLQEENAETVFVLGRLDVLGLAFVASGEHVCDLHILLGFRLLELVHQGQGQVVLVLRVFVVFVDGFLELVDADVVGGAFVHEVDFLDVGDVVAAEGLVVLFVPEVALVNDGLIVVDVCEFVLHTQPLLVVAGFVLVFLAEVHCALDVDTG